MNLCMAACAGLNLGGACGFQMDLVLYSDSSWTAGTLGFSFYIVSCPAVIFFKWWQEGLRSSKLYIVKHQTTPKFGKISYQCLTYS
jgi:hypothetical protein